MNPFIRLSKASQFGDQAWTVPAIDPVLLERHEPDAVWIHKDPATDSITARCSIWWKQVPAIEGEKLGVIGHYAASDGPSGAALLEHACMELRQQECSLAVGPMDGNTWRSYRLVTGHDDPQTHHPAQKPFFLEPSNPSEWPGHFQAAGFQSLATYTSALNDNLEFVDPRIERTLARLQSNGIDIRPINLQNFDSELDAIYQISIQSFPNNYLYTPITRDEFFEQYRPVQKWIRPELVSLAFQGSLAVGFVFAIPDMLEAGNGGSIQTAILKTVAVVPGRASAGLGSVLVSRVHTEACKLGFTRVIHALMHESNNSKNISGHYARTIRRYTLYSRCLR